MGSKRFNKTVIQLELYKSAFKFNHLIRKRKQIPFSPTKEIKIPNLNKIEIKFPQILFNTFLSAKSKAAEKKLK